MILIGIIILAIGLYFYWLNGASNVQTPLPMILCPLGFALLCIGIGRML